MSKSSEGEANMKRKYRGGGNAMQRRAELGALLHQLARGSRLTIWPPARALDSSHNRVQGLRRISITFASSLFSKIRLIDPASGFVLAFFLTHIVFKLPAQAGPAPLVITQLEAEWNPAAAKVE